MDKAPDAFRTISEVADDLGLPQHVLRFWETRFPQIKPMKRGGGRRYYRPDDVDLLRGIRHLLYGQGYTIRGVQRLLKDNGVKFIQASWRESGGEDDEDADGIGPSAELPAFDSTEADAPDDGIGEEADEPGDGDAIADDGEAVDADQQAAPDTEPSPESVAPDSAPSVKGHVSFGYQRRNFLPAAKPSPTPRERQEPPKPATVPEPRELRLRRGLEPAQRQRLQAALDELSECRKMIEAALRED